MGFFYPAVFRAPRTCSFHFYELAIRQSQRNAAVSNTSSGSRSTRIISERRVEGSGSTRGSRVGDRVLAIADFSAKICFGETPNPARESRALPGLKFLERFDQIPRQR